MIKEEGGARLAGGSYIELAAQSHKGDCKS